MIEELETETFLYISKDKFQIFLFEKKNFKNLYKDEIKFYKSHYIDFHNLNKFLESNIFKIEKLIKGFVKNISLVIDNKDVSNIDIGLKRKNYNYSINNNDLKNSITEIRELFKKNFSNQNIMHIIIKRFLVDDKNYSLLHEAVKGDYFCLEVQFISISKDFVIEVEKVLENYQIKVNRYLCANYILNFFKNDTLDLSHMAYEIQCGRNQYEVELIPKTLRKTGFFEKFFQLFS